MDFFFLAEISSRGIVASCTMVKFGLAFADGSEKHLNLRPGTEFSPICRPTQQACFRFHNVSIGATYSHV